MGKVRISSFGDEQQEQEERDRRKRQREEKKKRETLAAAPEVVETKEEKKAPKASKEGADTKESPKKESKEEVKEAKTEEKAPTKKEKKEDKHKKKEYQGSDEIITEEAEGEEKKSKKRKAKAGRGRLYKKAITQIEHKKLYAIEDAVILLKEISYSKFGGSVEVHINAIETGIRGRVTLPHGTGKKKKVAVADDALIEQLKSGKIDFDILVAHQSMMGKIASVAKVLGPRGLMPNPKAGTISTDPEKLAKELEGGNTEYKTEPKFPLIHQVIGKTSFEDKQIIENFQTLVLAIGKTKITAVTIKSTMSPGIKVAL